MGHYADPTADTIHQNSPKVVKKNKTERNQREGKNQSQYSRSHKRLFENPYQESIGGKLKGKFR